jgi:HK97 gp10 family phage protein
MIGMQIELDKRDMAKIDYILKNMDKRLGKKTVMKALRQGAKPVVRAAKQNAPVSGKRSFFTAHKHISKGVQSTRLNLHKAGELKRSIGVIIGRGGWSLYVGPRFGNAMRANDAWYAHFVEFGTATSGWGKGQSPQPYMRPAWDSQNTVTLNTISQELSKVCNEFLAKHKP